VFPDDNLQPAPGAELKAMETEAQTTGHRDALIAAGALLALGILWITLRLVWQGALLVAAALVVAYFGHYRLRFRQDQEPEPLPAKQKAAPSGARPKSKKRKKPHK
jgi:hypothetical protein